MILSLAVGFFIFPRFSHRHAIYLGCVTSPPSLMDDVDAVQAQIAKTMLMSGDWVTGTAGRGCSTSKKPPNLLAHGISIRFSGRLTGLRDCRWRSPP